MCHTFLVQTCELLLFCDRHVALGEEVFLVVFRGEGPLIEALWAIFYNLGDQEYFSYDIKVNKSQLTIVFPSKLASH